MLELFKQLFLSGPFIPHGHCYLWQSQLVWLHILSDSIIALAYYSIPLTLIYFVQKRKDLPFDGIFLLFSAFIVSCGTTHLMEIWTLWHPTYWLSGLLKALTAIISLYTAISLIQLIPQALALPSPTQLTSINEQLTRQIHDRRQAEDRVRQLNQDLEEKVTRRTAELEASVAQVKDYAERVTLAMDAAQMGSWDWDLQTQQVTWSPYHEILLGMQPGRPDRSYEEWAQRVYPDDLPKIEAAVQQAREAGTNFLQEYRVIWEDGSLHWLAGFGRFFYDNDGQPLRMLGMVQDITDRKRAEADLEARNNELDSFVHIVSHDLKAPLRAISNLSQWIEEDLKGNLSEEIQSHLSLLHNRVYRMQAMIDGLLNYARVGRTDELVERVIVEDLLREVIDSIDPPSTFKINLAPNLPTLHTKYLLLSQVFANLIDNAVKYHNQVNGTVHISAQDCGRFYEFIVADDGPGIAPEYQNNIFTIFQTGSPENQQASTGIGLAIVKKIVETETGSIRLESQIGKGTTFYFTWPKL